MALTDESGDIEYMDENNKMTWSLNDINDRMISPEFTINKIKSKLILIDNEGYYRESGGLRQLIIHLLLSPEATHTIEKVNMTLYSRNKKTSKCSQHYEFLNQLFPMIVWHFDDWSRDHHHYEFFRLNSLTELQIECEFIFKTTRLASLINPAVPSICEYYKELFNTGKFSDVTINVSGTEFKVHKCILSTRSKVFAAMLESHTMENKENKIHITDIDVNVMQDILRFMYFGSIEDISNKAIDLIPPADKYELLDLLTLCQNTLISIISLENIKQILYLINYIELNLLKESVLNFIKNNNQSLKTKDFYDFLNTLSKSLLTEIIFAF